jgi:hypothetical protein
MFKEPLSFWVKVLIISIFQLAIGLVVFDMYPVISMLFLGEGGDSLLYSNGNAIMWALSPIVLPGIFNLHQILNGLGKKTAATIRMYKVVGLMVFVIYLVFIIWWSQTHRFHI